jgi:hypothetical protein
LQRITAPVSYGLFDRKKQEEQAADLEATSQWRQFLEQVREMMAHYARIDVTVDKIQMEGKATLRAYTAISLDGDTTVLAPTDAAGEVSPSIWELHQVTVKQALDNRATMIKTMGDAAAAALKALSQAGGRLRFLALDRASHRGPVFILGGSSQAAVNAQQVGGV